MARKGGAQGLNAHYEKALAMPGATPPHGCATLGSNSATIGPSAQYQLGNQVAQRSPCHGYQSCSGLLRVHHHPDLVNHHSLWSGPSSRIAQSCGRSSIELASLSGTCTPDPGASLHTSHGGRSFGGRGGSRIISRCRRWQNLLRCQHVPESATKTVADMLALELAGGAAASSSWTRRGALRR